MIVAVICKNMLLKTRLSDAPNGDYQIRDYFNNVIGNLTYVENSWLFSCNHNYEVMTDKGPIKSCVVGTSSLFKLKNVFEQEELTVYIYPSYVENTIVILCIIHHYLEIICSHFYMIRICGS